MHKNEKIQTQKISLESEGLWSKRSEIEYGNKDSFLEKNGEFKAKLGCYYYYLLQFNTCSNKREDQRVEIKY